MHTRIQLDPSATIHLRTGRDNALEIVILDPNSECSSVIELSPTQLEAIRQGGILTPPVPARGPRANQREELATEVYYALLEAFGEDVAQRIEQSDAHGALVYRIQRLLEDGRELADLFGELDEDAVRFVPRADNPAAFLAKKLHELDGE